MKAPCTIHRTADGGWLAHHESAQFGVVEVRGASSDDALKKIERELQYRMEWCPCTGVSGDTVEVEVNASSGTVGA